MCIQPDGRLGGLSNTGLAPEVPPGRPRPGDPPLRAAPPGGGGASLSTVTPSSALLDKISADTTSPTAAGAPLGIPQFRDGGSDTGAFNPLLMPQPVRVPAQASYSQQLLSMDMPLVVGGDVRRRGSGSGSGGGGGAVDDVAARSGRRSTDAADDGDDDGSGSDSGDDTHNKEPTRRQRHASEHGRSHAKHGVAKQERQVSDSAPLSLVRSMTTKAGQALLKVRRDGRSFTDVYGPPLGVDVTSDQREQCEEYLRVRGSEWSAGGLMPLVHFRAACRGVDSSRALIWSSALWSFLYGVFSCLALALRVVVRFCVVHGAGPVLCD